jgi:CheY-like chemotaxis protein
LIALRILVIEDEAMIAMLLSDVLSSLGHSVTDLAATEAEATASASQVAPDLVIADANLGDGNGSGLSAIDTILASGFIPHVFVSGDSRSIETVRPGAIVMQKPFFEHELVSAIERAIARADAKTVQPVTIL